MTRKMTRMLLIVLGWLQKGLVSFFFSFLGLYSGRRKNPLGLNKIKCSAHRYKKKTQDPFFNLLHIGRRTAAAEHKEIGVQPVAKRKKPTRRNNPSSKKTITQSDYEFKNQQDFCRSLKRVSVSASEREFQWIWSFKDSTSRFSEEGTSLYFVFQNLRLRLGLRVRV